MSDDGKRIEESAEEAREGEDIPGMTTVLKVSIGLAVVAFAVLLLIFYGHTAGWFK